LTHRLYGDEEYIFASTKCVPFDRQQGGNAFVILLSAIYGHGGFAIEAVYLKDSVERLQEVRSNDFLVLHLGPVTP
jgi:hypothetical protein